MVISEAYQNDPDDVRIAAIERNKKPRTTVYGPPAPKPPSDDSDDDAR